MECIFCYISYFVFACILCVRNSKLLPQKCSSRADFEDMADR